MNLVERLKKFEDNKKEEKEIKKRIRLRKWIEALEDINKSVEMALKCDEIQFNVEVGSTAVGVYLGFKLKATGFHNVTFGITKRGLKRLNKQLIKYKIGD